MEISPAVVKNLHRCLFFGSSLAPGFEGKLGGKYNYSTRILLLGIPHIDIFSKNSYDGKHFIITLLKKLSSGHLLHKNPN